LSYNWFALAQTSGVAAALFLIGAAMLLEARARRVGNLIQLTAQHRDLWERMYADPKLARILDPEVDLARMRVTAEEEMFVVFIILHLSSTYYGIQSGFFQKPHGLRKDIERFFSLPIPRAVWEKVKPLQDAPFVKFVDQCYPSSNLAPYLHILHEADNRNRAIETESQQKLFDACQSRLQNLVRLKTSPENSDGRLLSDEEYARQRSDLLLEKTQLQAILGNNPEQAGRCLKPSCEVLDIAAMARLRFTKGDPETQR